MDPQPNNMSALPTAEIRMTHDVDALIKPYQSDLSRVLSISLMQPVHFNRQFLNVCRRLRQATRFLIGSENWWVFDRLIALENEARIIATYHFYADPRSKTFKRWLRPQLL